MNPIFAAALEMQEFCTARGFEFCFIGGQSNGAIPLDVSLGAMPFEERAVARASSFEIGEGVFLRTCSAEDLVVHKAFADRPKDWLDIEGIAARQAGRLDDTLIRTELRPLLELKGTPETEQRVTAVLRAARGSA